MYQCTSRSAGWGHRVHLLSAVCKHTSWTLLWLWSDLCKSPLHSGWRDRSLKELLSRVKQDVLIPRNNSHTFLDSSDVGFVGVWQDWHWELCFLPAMVKKTMSVEGIGSVFSVHPSVVVPSPDIARISALSVIFTDGRLSNNYLFSLSLILFFSVIRDSWWSCVPTCETCDYIVATCPATRSASSRCANEACLNLVRFRKSKSCQKHLQLLP